ncbi:MAG: hypothetical protein CL610_29520 [Anaerolineaceae bacterium]|nr:hypothetical protein [Anaerolineaceae bacterium]
MTGYDIVQLTADDWQAYKAIRLEALRNAPQAFGSTYADNMKHPDSFWRGRLEEAAAGERSWLLFARHEDQLVGLIGAFNDDDPTAVQIISMYITPAFRGQGVASALMSAILNILQQQARFQVARLTVNAEQTAAVRLYERLGFEIEKTEWLPAGDSQFHDIHTMAKALR